MENYKNKLQKRIAIARTRAIEFFKSLKVDQYSWRYTATHNLDKFPGAALYGTWSAILGLSSLKGTIQWSTEDKSWAIARLNDHRRPDKTFLPVGLENQATTKSLEYLILHCTNYSLGAALELDSTYAFESPYMQRFMDGDTLARWLEGRSLYRPWEEGNNIVNVASYLAICNDYGVRSASDRLGQLLEWHRKYQNPKTGGFDCFNSPGFNQRLQSLAGAVHNFHLHLYLREPFGYEEVIAGALSKYLVMGRLTACLSIDFVELAIRTFPFAQEPQNLIFALLHHTESLLASQRDDGGWLEADDNRTPTAGHGFQDLQPSSCSYATWFRMLSLAMIAIVLLGDDPNNWKFRKTLGMGYAPANWPEIPPGALVKNIPIGFRINSCLKSIPRKTKNNLLKLGSRFI
jgi:hypothetical protein